MVFDSRRVFEAYCQDDVSVLRQACQIFRREFIQIGITDVSLEAITVAWACNKFLRKRILKLNAIGLLQAGGYTCNNRCSKKPSCCWCIRKRRTVVKYFTVKMDVSTDCQNYVTRVWTVSVRKQKNYTNSVGASITAIPIYPSVSSPLCPEIP